MTLPDGPEPYPAFVGVTGGDPSLELFGQGWTPNPGSAGAPEGHRRYRSDDAE